MSRVLLMGAGTSNDEPPWTAGSFYRFDGNLFDSLSTRHMTDGGTGDPITYAAGKIGQGVIGGVNGWDTATSLSAGALTLSVWIKQTASPGGAGAGSWFSIHDDSFTPILSLFNSLSGGVLSTAFRTTAGTFGTATVGLNNWHHLVLTTDGSGSCEAYRNGTLVGSQACTAGPFSVGGWRITGNASEYLNDLMAVYPQHFDAAHVATFYNGGAGYDPTV